MYTAIIGLLKSEKSHHILRPYLMLINYDLITYILQFVDIGWKYHVSAEQI